MNKKVLGLIIILVVIVMVVIIAIVIKPKESNSDIINSNIVSKNNEDIFYASIEEINEYNGVTSVLVKGLENNDVNHRGEFEFSIDDDTEILLRENKVGISDLKVGQKISITSTGGVLERYPVELIKVTRVIILNENKI